MTVPMRPRDEIAAEVRAEREARKNSPASGGAENEVMRSTTPYQPEGMQGWFSSPAISDDGNCTGQSPSAGHQSQERK